MPEIRVGVSGWRYPRWRGDFYPRSLAQRRELEYVAARTSTVELNGSFYSLLRPSTYQRVHDETPDGFVVAVKGSRFITHMKRLRDVEPALANLCASGLLALGDKLGPMLWQLPATLPYDEEAAAAFLDLLPRSTDDVARLAHRHDDRIGGDRVLLEPRADVRVRHAFEVRHDSWTSDEAVALLRDREVALVVADSDGRWPCPEERTGDLRYVRLHGHTDLYASGYAPRSLDRWAEKCRRWREGGEDVLVHFDNDARGRAPWDAVGLLERLGPQASATVASSTNSGSSSRSP